MKSSTTGIRPVLNFRRMKNLLAKTTPSFMLPHQFSRELFNRDCLYPTENPSDVELAEWEPDPATFGECIPDSEYCLTQIGRSGP